YDHHADDLTVLRHADCESPALRRLVVPVVALDKCFRLAECDRDELKAHALLLTQYNLSLAIALAPVGGTSAALPQPHVPGQPQRSAAIRAYSLAVIRRHDAGVGHVPAAHSHVCGRLVAHDPPDSVPHSPPPSPRRADR